MWQILLTSTELPASDRRYAARQLARLRAPDASEFAPTHSTFTGLAPTTRTARVAQLEQDLEQALSASDLAESRRIATLLGVNPNQLAERALRSGSYAVALERGRHAPRLR